MYGWLCRAYLARYVITLARRAGTELNSVPAGASEPWRQVELEHPALAGTLPGMREVELPDREAEQVDAQRHTGAGHRLPIAAEEARALAAVVGDAGIGEQRHLHRNGPIHRLRDAERSQQREPELDVPDEH